MLKGTTKIELKDVKTGKVETYKKSNMVTDAVGDLLGMNPMGFKFQNGTMYDYYFPIIPNLIGGILLCQDPLIEDASKYWVPNENPVVGYANNVVSPGTDPKRGSFNTLESGKTEDGKGYKFVFDFTTSQGNGQIAALGLTSKQGGQDGYGNLITNTCGMYKILETTHTPSSSTTGWDYMRMMADIVAFDIPNNVAVCVYMTGPNAIGIKKIDMELAVFGLHTEPEQFECYRQYKEYSLLTTKFGSYISSNASDSSTYHFTFLNDEDGYIWGFEHEGNTSGNSSGDAVINWIKIKIDDLTFEEGTWTLPIQTTNFGYNYYYRYGSSSTKRETHAIINNGVLYHISNNSAGIYAIPLEDPENWSFISHPDGKVTLVYPYYYSNTYYYFATAFNKIYDTVYFGNGYIEGDKIIPIKTNWATNIYPGDLRPYGLQFTAKPGLRVGPFLFCYGAHHSYGLRRQIFVLQNYLATINNLETPIVKTADKTMKITYTLNVE